MYIINTSHVTSWEADAHPFHLRGKEEGRDRVFLAELVNKGLADIDCGRTGQQQVFNFSVFQNRLKDIQYLSEL